MPPQAQAPQPTQVPAGQVNPQLIAMLQARAQQSMQGAPGNATAPNSMPIPGAPGMPAPGAPRVVSPGAGPATPTSAVMKAASQAQSPLVADTGTRALAKQLIQKLMQHM